MTGPVTAPHVYRAINAISTALSKTGISKINTNLQEQYQYRSIDDVLAKLSPLLSRHRLCVLPRVLRRRACYRTGEANSVLVGVELLVAYDLVSCRDGSKHTVRAFGEAVDPSDKATAKALSAAYKSAMLQTFCIPVTGSEDADAASHRVQKQAVEREPVQGWPAWSDDIVDMIRVCESSEALDRMRNRQAALLTAIRRERADLYTGIGEAFANRLRDLAHPSPLPPEPKRDLLVGNKAPSSQEEPVDA